LCGKAYCEITCPDYIKICADAISAKERVHNASLIKIAGLVVGDGISLEFRGSVAGNFAQNYALTVEIAGIMVFYNGILSCPANPIAVVQEFSYSASLIVKRLRALSSRIMIF